MLYSYGIHLAQALTQKVIDRGYRPFVVIRPENDASRNLYKKLGYSKAFETCRVTLNPTKLGLPEDQYIVLQPHLLHAAELAASAAADEGIEDGRNEDTLSLNEAALRGHGHVNGNNDNDDDKDEGIDDDGETQMEEEQPQQHNGNAEGVGKVCDEAAEAAAAKADGDNGD